MINLTLYRNLLSGAFSPRKRRRIISSLLIAGTFLIIGATILTAYNIPHIDSAISKIDRDITDCENVNVQLEMLQFMGSVPYHLTTMLDLFPASPTWIKEDLAHEIKKSQIAYLTLLYSPTSPSAEDQTRWAGMTFDGLEQERINRTGLYLEAVQVIIEQRRELLAEKQSLLFWSILLQLLGVAATAGGTLLRSLYK